MLLAAQLTTTDRNLIMESGADILKSALEGWQARGDIEKYTSLDDIKHVEPAVYQAHQRVKIAGRELELIIKGALRERGD